MNEPTKDRLRQFKPKCSFIVGFDSDGCVFDSMELKHKECIIPNIIKYYKLQSISKYAREAAEFVNLYSFWRGANRFPALVKMFELLEKRPEIGQRRFILPDVRPIQKFIGQASALGNPALKEYISKFPDPFLSQLLLWSESVNRSIADMVQGLPPFPYVMDSFEKIKGKADAMVMSATPVEALQREWHEHGIDGYTGIIAGQEMGPKDEQLKLAVQGKYPPDHILIVGDAFGDLNAARSVDAFFYPIIPGEEELSWKIFRDEIVDRFLAGKYTKKIETKYLQKFEKALPKDPPWIR